jgi:hypothetical protein
MQPDDLHTLRQRVLSTLSVLYDAIADGRLLPIALSVELQTDAVTGALTGEQTLTLTTRPPS